MALIKTGLDRLSVPDKIQYARQIVLDMTGNANFPTPNPALTSVTTAANNLESSYNAAQTARQISKSKTSDQDVKSVALDMIVTQLANYVENTSNGDKTKIESAGFSTRNPATPPLPMMAPEDLQVFPSAGAGTGSADLSWAPVRGAYTYNIERAADAPVLTWGNVGVATKSKATVNSMTSGLKYWFRVTAVGPAGQGPASDPVPLFAP